MRVVCQIPGVTHDGEPWLPGEVLDLPAATVTHLRECHGADAFPDAPPAERKRRKPRGETR
jgi:hypothetical protein